MDTKPSTSDIISKLRFLSFIKRNQKINTRRTDIYDNRWYDFLIRNLVAPENRYDTIRFVSTVIEEGIQSRDEETDPDLQNVLFHCVLEAVAGIENLKYTYNEDPYVKAQFDAILIQIQLFRRRVEENVRRRCSDESCESR